MELLNDMQKFHQDNPGPSKIWNEAVDIYLRMLAPVAPHISEEIWANLGKPYSVHTRDWPVVDETAAADESITLVLQVNGKVRDRLVVAVNVTEAEAKTAALANEAVLRALDGRQPRQVIYVAGRLVNVVG
jgi:leucyl-tRNA synthetase